MNACRIAILALLAVLSASLPATVENAFGQTLWSTAVGNWNTAANWSLGVPNSASPAAFDAVIANGGTAQLLGPPNGSVRRLRVGTAGGAGNLMINGATLTVTENFHLNEGSAGPASMTVQGGSKVTAPSTIVGHSSAPDSNLLITGAGTVYDAATEIIVGRAGLGTATLNLNGGAVLNSGVATIGRSSNGAGHATVSGVGSRWSSTGEFTVGLTGPGTLTIADHGTVHVDEELVINAASTVNLNGGTLRFNVVTGAGGLSRLVPFYASGTIQLEGDRRSDFTPVTAIFGASPEIPSGKGLTIEGGFDVRNNFTVNGGALAAQAAERSLQVQGEVDSVTLAITQGGDVTALETRIQASDRSATINVNGVGSTLSTNEMILEDRPGTSGSPKLEISGGGGITVAQNVTMGPEAGGGGALATTMGAGSNWMIGGNLNVGAPGGGAAKLYIRDQSLVHVGGVLQINDLSNVYLEGGTLRFASVVTGPPLTGRIQHTSGAFQLAGDRTIGGALSGPIVSQFYGFQPVVPTGKGLFVEGTATIAATLTVAGGAFQAYAIAIASGAELDFDRGRLELTGGPITGLSSLTVPPNGEFRARGLQSLSVAGAAGSTITATGNFTLGNASAFNGFGTQGTVQVGPNLLTLLDANEVVFGSLSFTTLGSGANPGAIVAANGLLLEAGGNLTGFGTLSTPNSLAKPLSNNGHISGDSPTRRITLSGYVKGVGTFDNVSFTGVLSPGLSSTILTVGNVAFSPTSTLIMELGGPMPGSGYDQIQSSDALAFDGTLVVTLANGFSPVAGQSFKLFDWVSASGEFDVLHLPELPGLAWDASQLYAAGMLSVVPAATADFDADGDVDGADLNKWKLGFGKPSGAVHAQGDADIDGDVDGTDFLTWQRQRGLHAAVVPNGIAAPEPASLLLALALGMAPPRGRTPWSAQKKRKNARRVRSLTNDEVQVTNH